DVDTGRLEVIVDADAATRIVDRDLCGSEPNFDAHRGDAIRLQLRGSIPTPLGDETKEILDRWRNLTLDRCHPYEHDAWEPLTSAGSDRIPELRFAPA